MTALVVTSTPVVNGKQHRSIYVTVLAPATPTDAVNTIIYDPTASPYSTVAAYGTTAIRRIRVVSSCKGNAGTMCNIALNWDASTPVVMCSVPSNGQFEINYDHNILFPPLPNQGGSGVTGKIGLTTNGIIAGDSITIILDISNGSVFP